MNNTDQNPITPFWILILCLAVSFAGILDRDLWTPDEPRDAAISLEMGRTGNIIIPHLAGQPFVEKPPMYFAVAGFFSKTLGSTFGNTGAIRLSTAIWGLGTLLMTFLLGRRLMNHDGAILATAILATMAGFILNMHWIRVDAALVFFVAAAVWGFAEAYMGGRRWFCLAGGLFTAGAFLSKGVIGPLLVGIAWLGLIIPWLMSQRGKKWDLMIPQHLLALVLFILPVAYWMFMLRQTGGEKLWHEWFYENHFGRLSGTATALGHMRAGHPFYYIEVILFYTLPWLPAVAILLFTSTRDLFKTRNISSTHIFLGIWCVGSVLLLSASVTKREIYLAPVLPAFALVCAQALAGEPPLWTRYFFSFWSALAMVILAASAISPLWAGFLPASVPAKVTVSLHAFSPRNILAGLCLAGCIAVLFYRRRDISQTARLAAVTALLFIGFFAVPSRAIDAEKELGTETRAFASRIPPEKRNRIAGWGFNETSRAMFYFYCDWTVPLISDNKRVLTVVAGKDREYDSVIVTEDTSIPDFFAGTPYKIITEEQVGAGKHKRGLYWITGKDSGMKTEN